MREGNNTHSCLFVLLCVPLQTTNSEELEPGLKYIPCIIPSLESTSATKSLGQGQLSKDFTEIFALPVCTMFVLF